MKKLKKNKLYKIATALCKKYNYDVDFPKLTYVSYSSSRGYESITFSAGDYDFYFSNVGYFVLRVSFYDDYCKPHEIFYKALFIDELSKMIDFDVRQMLC